MERKEMEGVEGTQVVLPGVARDLEGVSDSVVARRDAEKGWLEGGAEDPAFFIKPSDGD